ncbi:hypothetical protein BKA00_001858 [Actinomadura coerulea]|uniref:Uncharacterized protein n=1 Tax=Actinomadura coerulea TaxID=46159 RepID=A0A7X0FWE3_9ACTN|nr:hypothetical protein [Actinomadura coerulea]GGQ45781.1 hypothetical protein GCM10010187_75100 [Actinomadura coerulea]
MTAGLRELKKQQTRQAISGTATRLFLERGFEKVSPIRQLSCPAARAIPALPELVRTDERQLARNGSLGFLG